MSTLDERVSELIETGGEELSEAVKLDLLALQQMRLWRSSARPEQIAPQGDWRTWYIQAGRGAGKTKAGAEWLAEQEARHPPGSWGIVAPTFADGRDTCVEDALLPILGPRVSPKGWNRSLGEIFLRSGSRIYVDGADDGALRVQGKNLRGLWADEIGLWVKWDLAWNESIAFAVRMLPAQIVATGTPKMGHGLVRQLIEDETVHITRMRTDDNIGNLPPHVIKQLYEEHAGTIRGRQELDGEWISHLEGDALKRAWWRYYQPQRKGEAFDAFIRRLPTFQMVVISVDTPLKDKDSSDFVAAQIWGVDKANRYLLDARTERMSYEQAKRAITEMARFARKTWRCRHAILIENAGYGVELLTDLQRDLGGTHKITSNAEGTKGQRALAAAGDLETGNVYLPGRQKEDLTGPDPQATPALTLSLIEEAAMFQVDGSHDSHDDQVDAWSQAMNWLRSRQTAPARTYSAFKLGRR